MPMPFNVPTGVPVVFDHFTKLDAAATNGQWLSTNDGATGTLAISSTLPGGWINIPSAGADNDYQLLSTQQPILKMAAASGAQTGTSINFQARFKLTEAATNAANFVLGLSSVLTAGFLQADGGGVPSNFSGAVIYKKDGGASLLAATSNGTAQTKDATLCAFTSGSTYTVAIDVNVNDSVTCIVRFWVKDETAGVLYQPEQLGKGVGVHQVPFASLAAMYPVIGVKAGSSSAETLSVDYVYAAQNSTGG